ncbi:MAG: serine hydrolase [Haloplanus sp.]
MRPATPAIATRDRLREYVTAYADRIDGRLGVRVAVLNDADDRDIVVSHRPDRPYASASVIKLPVLYALYRAHAGDLDALREPHGLADENRVGGSGLLHLLDVEPSLRDLARAMIAVSDNAATNELIDHLGREAINEAASDLGMGHTHLGRKLMTTLEGESEESGAESESDADGDSSDPTNTTAPLDCVRFFAELCHGDRLSERAREEMLEALGHQKDISMFPRYLPYEDEGAGDLAHKTGWLPTAALDTGVVLPDAGGPGVVAADADSPLCFAVFVDRVSHGGDGTDVIAEIGDAVFAWYRNRRE